MLKRSIFRWKARVGFFVGLFSGTLMAVCFIVACYVIGDINAPEKEIPWPDTLPFDGVHLSVPPTTENMGEVEGIK